MKDITGRIMGNVGILRLNKEHRYNVLSPTFAKQISRGVRSLNMDHSVRLIYLTTANGEHFSMGTDFRTL